MKRTLIVVAGCGLFATVAATGEAQSQSAQDFINKVAISDMFEILATVD